jgi:hypothetical protein
MPSNTDVPTGTHPPSLSTVLPGTSGRTESLRVTASSAVAKFCAVTDSHARVVANLSRAVSDHIRFSHVVTGKEVERNRCRANYQAARLADQHHAWLGTQIMIALLLLPFEWFAANIAAQAAGTDPTTTTLLTVLFLVLLVIGEVLVDVAGRLDKLLLRRTVLIALGAFLLVLGGLRFDYALVVEARGPLSALLVAALLTMITAALVAGGCFALNMAESFATWRERTASRRADRAFTSARGASDRAETQLKKIEAQFWALIEGWIVTADLPVRETRDEVRGYVAGLVARHESSGA